MPRTSKVEKYAIQWLSYQGFDIASISKELKLPENSIQNILEKNQHINKDNIVPSGSEPVGTKKKPKSLLINETAVKKTNSVAIMTEAASQQVDEARKRISTRNNNKNIYRPNG
jgi:hypothetical protein